MIPFVGPRSNGSELKNSCGWNLSKQKDYFKTCCSLSNAFFISTSPSFPSVGTVEVSHQLQSAFLALSTYISFLLYVKPDDERLLKTLLVMYIDLWAPSKYLVSICFILVEISKKFKMI